MYKQSQRFMKSQIILVFIILIFFMPMIVHNFCKQTSFLTKSLEIKAIARAPTGRYLAVAHSDNVIRFYNGKNYNQIGNYTNITGPINAMDFSNDGMYLALAGNNANVYLLNGYQPFSFNRTLSATLSSPLVNVDFSEDSTHLVACGTGKAAIFNMVTFNVTGSSTFTPAANTVNDCKFNGLNASSIRMTANNQKYFVTFDTAMNTFVNRTGPKYYRQAYNPTNTNMIYIERTNTTANKLFFTDLGSLTYTDIQMTINISGVIPSQVLNVVAYSTSGSYFASGGTYNKAYIFDSTLKYLTQVWTMTDAVTSIVFSRQTINQRVYIGDKKGQILILGLNCSKNCGAQYYFQNGICNFCASQIPNCVTCMNKTVCDKCVAGFYVDSTDYKCKGCGVLGCMTCSSNNTCDQCHSGFYLALNTTTNLMVCFKCDYLSTMTGCAICSNNSYCLACNNDYYLDNVTYLCKKCSTITGCLKCYNSTDCIQCKVGYYVTLTAGCAACYSGCLACQGSATNCTQCTKGYYSNSTFNCVQCRTGCLTCNNSNFCFECTNDMYQKSDGTCDFCKFPCINCLDNSTCYKCVAGYYIDSGSTTCSKCANNCEVCVNSTGCLSCQAGYYYISSNFSCKACSQTYGKCSYCSNSSCEICQLGYFLNSTPSCQHCSQKMFKCQSCSNQTTCLSCIQGFYLTTNTGNSSCASCDLGCQTCLNSTYCRKCFQNYYLDSTNKCISCPNNCLECKQNQDCVVCDQGYYLDGIVCKICSINLTNCIACISGQQCSSCQVSYYLDSTNKNCSSCSSKPNCLTCKQSDCLSCNLGYYLNSSSCVSCPQLCASCYSPTNCSSCISGYYLNSSLNECKKCTTKNRYCRTCSQTQCYSCIGGYYLDNSINASVYKCSSCITSIQGCLNCNSTSYCSSCDYGYFLNTSSNKCIICLLNGCQKCSSQTACLKCSLGYYLNSSNNKCQLCDNSCTSCNSSGICFSCNLGFYLSISTNSCLPCHQSISGCNLCTDLNTCTQCINGYYLDLTDNKCKFCRNSLIGCLYCKDSSICTNCQPGFYLFNNSMCKTCSSLISGCQFCFNQTVCFDCTTGYYLTSGGGSGCTMCSSSIQGCISCKDINTCEICKTGYYLNSTSKLCELCSQKNNGCMLCDPDLTYDIKCHQCSTGFYISSLNNLCSACNQTGCQICLQSSPNQCLTCNSLYYKNISAHTCQLCSSYMEGCNNCINPTSCLGCDIGYYLNQTTNMCFLCQDNLNLIGCAKCQYIRTTLTCMKCKSSFILDITTNNCRSCYELMEGCTYCTNSTYCASCANGYYRNSTTDLCETCMKQPGCLLCISQSICQYCSPGYYLNTSLQQCTKCSDVIQFCITCFDNTKCLSCQSGYAVTTEFKCQAVTVTSTEKIQQLKFITQYINDNTLSHTLFAKNLIFKNTDYNMTGKCNLYMTDYSQLQKINKIFQVLLQIKQIKFISDSQLRVLTNNPAKLDSGNSMGMLKRMLQQQEKINNVRLLVSASSLQNYKVSIQMKQQAANTIMPNLYQVGDVVLDYSLDQPQFYMSYLKQTGSSFWYFAFFGYFACVLIIVNFIFKTMKVQKTEFCNNHFTGQIISHIFALKTIGMILYPIQAELYSFCYGFALVDFPWINTYLGQLLAKRSDYVPETYIMYFYSLSIASTFLISLILFAILISSKYLFIDHNHQLSRQKYTKLIYNIFLFGLIFAGSLSLQGALYNPIKTVSLNAFFYLIGILLFIFIFIQIIYSLNKSKQNFYKIRIFIKASMLSIGHVNPITVFSIAVIIDLLMIGLQYVIIQRQVFFGKPKGLSTKSTSSSSQGSFKNLAKQRQKQQNFNFEDQNNINSNKIKKFSTSSSSSSSSQNKISKSNQLNILKYLFFSNNILSNISLIILFFYPSALISFIFVAIITLTIIVSQFVITFGYIQKYYQAIGKCSSEEKSGKNSAFIVPKDIIENEKEKQDLNQPIERDRIRRDDHNLNTRFPSRNKNVKMQVNESQQTLFNAIDQQNQLQQVPKFNLWDVGNYQNIENIKQIPEINDERIQKVKKDFYGIKDNNNSSSSGSGQNKKSDQRKQKQFEMQDIKRNNNKSKNKSMNNTRSNFNKTSNNHYVKKQTLLKQDSLVLLNVNFQSNNVSINQDNNFRKNSYGHTQNLRKNYQTLEPIQYEIKRKRTQNKNINNNKGTKFLKAANKVPVRSKKDDVQKYGFYE